MCNDVFVLGGGGHGAVVIATARAAGFDVVGVYDDRSGIHGTTVMGVPVLGTIAEASAAIGAEAVVAIGDNKTRSAVAQRVPLQLATIVHPSANVGDDVTVGEGTVVFAGVTIQARTAIGDHVIVNSGVIVDHDCQVGDFVHIAPGTTICGDVEIGGGAFIGAGATITPGITVGVGAVVGAGAVVLNDVGPGTTVVGVPARVLGDR